MKRKMWKEPDMQKTETHVHRKYFTLVSFDALVALTILLFCENPFKSFSQSAKKSSSSAFLLLLSSCSCESKNSYKNKHLKKNKKKTKWNGENGVLTKMA